MRYYHVIDQNLSSYYLTTKSLLDALDTNEITNNEYCSDDEMIYQPIDDDNLELACRIHETNICHHCGIGYIHRIDYPEFPYLPNYEYCDYCNYDSCPPIEEDIPYYYA